MIQEVMMYRVVCDGQPCGESAQEYGDYYAWADDGQAEDEARDAEWLITEDGKHYCPAHVTYDEEADEFVPDPVGVNGVSKSDHVQQPPAGLTEGCAGPV